MIKYICAVIAIFATTCFISSIVASIVAGPAVFKEPDNVNSEADRMAAFRIICGIVMGITWGVLIVF